MISSRFVYLTFNRGMHVKIIEFGLVIFKIYADLRVLNLLITKKLIAFLR